MCLDRTYWEEWEKTNLAPYASKSDDKEISKRVDELTDIEDIRDPAGSESRYRTSFQIDKDRILNSTAFRRLEYKTQIFVNHEGDHYRTRLTHTTEVTSIARRIAKALRLNEDLVEAIALGHDLGHTPFGHAGEEALNSDVLGKYGFYHNVHSLRIIDELEEGYDWDRRNNRNGGSKGLNLTFAVRDGILKHTDRLLRPGRKPILDEADILRGFDILSPPTLEAQVVALADEISQRVNDLEDGLRSGLISKYEVMSLIKESITNDKNDFIWLIRAEPASRGDEEIVNRRTEKYFSIIKLCQNNNNGSPTMRNLIGFIRELWTANAIEYSRYKIKSFTEVSRTIENNFNSQINTFTYGKQEKFENLENIVPVDKLKQDLLKGGDSTEAEFCEIDISKEKKAYIKIVRKKLKRDKNNEELKTIDENTMEESWSLDYFIKWINSDMAVWRTQRVLVLAITTNGKKIYKNYPIEQIKIKIRENVITFSDREKKEISMKKIDKNFKCFIEKYIHRSSKVSRMNTKGVELVKKVFERFIENPFQLQKNVLNKYKSGQFNKFNDTKSLDDFVKKIGKNDAYFNQILAEHIAGMTDRFLMNEYERLFLPSRYIEEKEELYF